MSQRQGLATNARLCVSKLPGGPAENVTKITLSRGSQSRSGVGIRRPIGERPFRKCGRVFLQRIGRVERAEPSRSASE